MKATSRQIEMPDSWSDPLAPDDAPAGKVKYPAALAMEVAREICPLLEPLCEAGQLKVCGSLRRRKAEVGDVEFVFVPRIVTIRPAQTDLLGAILKPAVAIAATWPLLDNLVDRGVLAKRLKSNGAVSSWGPWNRYAVHLETGLPLDFFGCMGLAYWNMVVCRTGGKTTNTRICAAAIALGWHWEPSPEEAGFQRMVGLKKEQHAVRSEREVFEFVRMPYLEPWERE